MAVAITSKPDMMCGEWCIDGTRIPAQMVKGYTARGYTAEQIIREFPTLSVEQIEAAIAFEEPRETPLVEHVAVALWRDDALQDFGGVIPDDWEGWLTAPRRYYRRLARVATEAAASFTEAA